MEHIIEYRNDGEEWECETVEASSWNEAVELAPEEAIRADEWKVLVKSELINKEEAIHTGVLDKILPE
jgi:hypothetical protein